MKMFVCNYHLDDPTTFLYYQIQVYSAHARIHAAGYKMHFPCFTCTDSKFFKTVHKFKISEDRPAGECMETKMSKFAAQRQ